MNMTRLCGTGVPAHKPGGDASQGWQQVLAVTGIFQHDGWEVENPPPHGAYLRGSLLQHAGIAQISVRHLSSLSPAERTTPEAGPKPWWDYSRCHGR